MIPTLQHRNAREAVRYQRLAFFQKIGFGPLAMLIAYGALLGLKEALVINAVGSLAYALSWFLLYRRSSVDAACWTLLLGFTVFIGGNAMIAGQLRSEILWLLPCIPMVASFVMSRRSTSGCIAFCTLLLLGISLFDVYGPDLILYHRNWFESFGTRVCGLFIFSQFGIVASKISDAQVQELNQERKRLQASKRDAERAKLSKSAFLATMSHEIRTPMNGILGMTQHLLNQPRPAKQREALEMIQHSSEGLMLLLSDILDLSKLDVGKLRFDEHPFDLGACIQDCVRSFRAGASHHHIDLHFAPPTSALWVLGDQKRMTQILRGLIYSTVDTNPNPGRLSLVLSWQAPLIQEGRSAIEITLEDHRPAHRAFDHSMMMCTQESLELQAGDRGARPNVLGLALCRRLVKALHGRLETHPGESGTRFVVHLALPLTTAPARLRQTPSPEALIGQVAHRNLRVLVVDDNPINRKVAGLVLQKMAAQVDYAHDGQQAIDCAEQNPYDLILMDLRMPQIDGLQASQRILQGQGPNCQTPIIALTANSSPEDRQASLDAGMAGYLTKPFRAEQLAEIMDQVLAQDQVAVA